MSGQTTHASAAFETKESWVPMIAIALGQAIMSFNVASLPVALSGMVESFGVPPTTIATGIVMYSLAVAGFVMLGAKLVQRFGSTQVFRIVVALFGVAQVLMTFSPTATFMMVAQLLCGLAAAVIVPALVALIANHYHGQQQATAVGALGSARAGAGVAAFLIGGVLGTFIGWRPVFGILIVTSAIVFFLSFKLKPEEARPEVKIDPIGAILAASAIIILTFGFNNLNRWGLGIARDAAPFDVFGLSPAPLMIVTGIVLMNFFVFWTRRQQNSGRTPLLDLRVIASGQERAAVIAMMAVVTLEAMLNFSVPLYIQIVQGRSPLETAVAMLPFNLTVFFTAMLVVRLYKVYTPRVIGMTGFVLCAIALFWLAFVVRNDWSAPIVMIGLIVFGIGQGALVTLVFNVLVTAVPKELAGDVGSLRGTANNLAAGVGTALAGALLVGLLSASIMSRIADNPTLPVELQAEVDLDSINFINNERLLSVMQQTSASPEQVAEAVRVNMESRLQALKIGLLIMACIALLAIFPASRLPAYRPGEIPANPPIRPVPVPEEELA
ncbi:MFS transporter [Aureimonas fodinaquatilis]|uniref:MFS transporter n=1 Tax=Aureimonas fodinaquatilis TaxID=2565783 RepID=A0A5B0DYM5_9HYPH|nr:MFS transporter [Aureimonas fodinaquatilis]KAA0971927.1 MFS transporter [Aureimonas fodinaquatilis]